MFLSLCFPSKNWVARGLVAELNDIGQEKREKWHRACWGPSTASGDWWLLLGGELGVCLRVNVCVCAPVCVCMLQSGICPRPLCWWGSLGSVSGSASGTGDRSAPPAPASSALHRMATAATWAAPSPKTSCPRWRTAACRLAREAPAGPGPWKSIRWSHFGGTPISVSGGLSGRAETCCYPCLWPGHRSPGIPSPPPSLPPQPRGPDSLYYSSGLTRSGGQALCGPGAAHPRTRLFPSPASVSLLCKKSGTVGPWRPLPALWGPFCEGLVACKLCWGLGPRPGMADGSKSSSMAEVAASSTLLWEEWQGLVTSALSVEEAVVAGLQRGASRSPQDAGRSGLSCLAISLRACAPGWWMAGPSPSQVSVEGWGRARRARSRAR